MASDGRDDSHGSAASRTHRLPSSRPIATCGQGRGTGAPAPETDGGRLVVGGPPSTGRRAETPVPARRVGVRDQARGADALVEAGDRPAPRAVLERQGEPRSRRVDLEQRPRAADHGIGRGLLADDRETGDRESLVAPRDLTRTTVEPVGPDLDLTGSTRMNAIGMAPFRGLGRWVVSSGALVRQNVCSVVTDD